MLIKVGTLYLITHSARRQWVQFSRVWDRYDRLLHGRSLRPGLLRNLCVYYSDVIMGAMAAQITSLTFVYSTVYSVANQRKHQSPASLAFVPGIHRWPVNSPHKRPVTRKMFPFDDQHGFPGLVLVWPEAVLQTNQKPSLKILVN